MIHYQTDTERKQAADAEAWRNRFLWLASRHWVESEATFRMNLRGTEEDAAEYERKLIAAIDAAMKEQP